MEGEIHIQPSSASLSKVSNILDGLYTQKEVIGLHKAAVEKNPSAFPPKELENIEKVNNKNFLFLFIIFFLFCFYKENTKFKFRNQRMENFNFSKTRCIVMKQIKFFFFFFLTPF